MTRNVRHKVNDKHNQILISAREIILANPKSKLTAQNVASHSNIARTSIYEYFTSMNHLMGELLLTELVEFRVKIRRELSEITDPFLMVEKWVDVNLKFFADGSHALVLALMPVTMKSSWRDEIKSQHIALYDELRQSLVKVGIEISTVRFDLITAVLERAAQRIESSTTPDQVRIETVRFIKSSLI